MIDPTLAAVRAVHYAATLLLEGVVLFRFLVAEGGAPGREDCTRCTLHAFLRWTTALAWVVLLFSGMAWVLVLSGRIADTSPLGALRQGIDWTLLSQTQFGKIWQLRGVTALLLILALVAAERVKRTTIWKGILPIVLSLTLAGTLAWSGHGAATPGKIGDLHLVADVAHIVFAGFWLGGLLPFAVLLRQLKSDATAAGAISDVTSRFSFLALIGVSALLLTGIVNAWVLVGSAAAFTRTLYGELLLAKTGLFVLMLAFAAVNRFYLMPRLASGTNATRRVAGRLAVHSGCELALGLAVLGIVGVLGMLPPPAG